MPHLGINDGEMFPLAMHATGAGMWQVICHVANHHFKGMVTNYRVYEDNCPLPPPGQVDTPSGTMAAGPSNTATVAAGVASPSSKSMAMAMTTDAPAASTPATAGQPSGGAGWESGYTSKWRA